MHPISPARIGWCASSYVVSIRPADVVRGLRRGRGSGVHDRLRARLSGAGDDNPRTGPSSAKQPTTAAASTHAPPRGDRGRGQVLDRGQLRAHGWNAADFASSNIVDQYIRYLRNKIDEPFGVRSIETVRGLGYRLRPDGGRAGLE